VNLHSPGQSLLSIAGEVIFLFSVRFAIPAAICLRRRTREQAALTMMTDQESTVFTDGVDEALESLPEGDRNVILLRYFDEQSHRAVGDSLGISEEAARRASERSRGALPACLREP
jgi:DNA-directed RNA polymerase specialized sigma24 family protein